jgi:ATP-binding cassette subfamily F protein 3
MPKTEESKPSHNGHTNSNDAKKAAKELADVETRITALEKELAIYEAQLADPAIYANASQLKDATMKFETVKKELAAQTQRWETLV